MKVFLSVFIVLAVLTAPVLAYEETRELTLSAEDIEKLEIDCGSGFLKVTNNEHAQKIEVTAEIVIINVNDTEAEELLDKGMNLYLKRKGRRALLNSHFKKPLKYSFRRDPQVSINVTVRTPKNIDLDIDDGSGNIEIRNTSGELDITDGSGSIVLDHIEGDVDIDDGSGSIEVMEIEGSVVVDDGSGSININGVVNNVTIE